MLKRLSLLAIVITLSCSPDEELSSFYPRPFSLSSVREVFDSAASLEVKAVFSTLRPDTIKSFGFAFTDALPTAVQPDRNVHHTITYNDIESATNADDGSYTFSAMINPTRESPEGQSEVSTSTVVSFIENKQGKTFFSAPEYINWDKPRITDLFPTKAAPGTVMTGRLNRFVRNNKMPGYSTAGLSVEEPFTVTIGDQEVPVETFSLTGDTTYGDGYRFKFKMPGGIGAPATIALKVRDYKRPYSAEVVNTNIGSELLTKTPKTMSGDFYAFALPGRIYLGGGYLSQGGPLSPAFAKFDVGTRSWSKVAGMPADAKAAGMTYTLGDKTYCGDPQNMYAYNASMDNWERIPAPTNELQYDHTFSRAASVVYEDQAYFNNFRKTFTDGGILYNNFWRYDEWGQRYELVTAYPGPTITAGYSLALTNGVVIENRSNPINDTFHFVRGLEHWQYAVQQSEWKRLRDVSSTGWYGKPFLCKGVLYCIVRDDQPSPIGGTTPTLRLMRHLPDTDRWILDSDIPKLHESSSVTRYPSAFYILSAPETDERYLVVQGSQLFFIFRMFSAERS